MRLVKVAAATLNQTPLDWDGNKANIIEALDRARSEGVGILCLPELCISGYGCEDAFLSPGVHEMAWRVLEEIAEVSHGLVVGLGLPVFHNKAAYNACCLLDNGEIVGFVAKRALAGDGIHYEPRWFKPWPQGKRSALRVRGKEYPIGDLFFECGGIKIGFEICEDAWIAQRPGAELALDAVDVILNPSASHFAFDKADVRRRLVLEGSRAFGVTYVYANLKGNEAGRAIYDGDSLIAAAGAMVARSPRFGFGTVDLLTAVVDVDLTRSRHAWLASFVPHVAVSTAQCIAVAHTYPEAEPEQPDQRVAAWETSHRLKEEEFARALALGLFDYLRKSRSCGFVVSLSGGVDSATVACLAALMVQLGVAELGVEGMRRKLAHIPALAEAGDTRAIVRALLTTVYQSTCNSSEVTRRAARGVADAIGSQHLELDVDPLVRSYTSLIEEATGETLSWQEHDLALQNIQARVRAPSVWMLANMWRCLLLSTSNRSEAAVGYATMDGDTAGGLSPIAGIDKAFLRKWLRFMQEEGPAGVGPLPALAAVNEQAPTAELRPLSSGQTDEADLMPYDLLDVIERSAIRDRRTPLDVYRILRKTRSDIERADLLRWVERFFVLWSRNQWKRERYAPSFHVDDENLDPKTWCRFPILSGGFSRELTELRAYYANER
jgi:NAD+ synthase (glutamine-hydrolysing)